MAAPGVMAAVEVRAAEPKVIVLGFDGADPALAARFMGEGHLPNLQRLSRQGQFVPLTTTSPSESPLGASVTFPAEELRDVEPNVEIYMEPINWNPKRLPPNVRISHLPGYAGEQGGCDRLL